MKLRNSRGSVLLEVLVALLILAFGGLVVVDSSARIAAIAFRVADTEAMFRQADQYMTAISLWSPEELNRHLGRHRRGRWVLDVQRTANALYEVNVMDSTASRTLLHTTLYRWTATQPGSGP